MHSHGPSTSLLVINYGTPELVRNLLSSLAAGPDGTAVSEVVIVDNGSPDRAGCEALLTTPSPGTPVHVLKNSQSSYSSGVNVGVRFARGSHLLVSNSDIAFGPDPAVGVMLQEMTDEQKVGVCGVQLLFPNGTWQESYRPQTGSHSWLKILLFGDVLDRARAVRDYRAGASARDVDYVVGAFMMINRLCLEEVGGFDERFAFYGEEADFCTRARELGWAVRFTSWATVAHVGGASSSSSEAVRYHQMLMQAKREFLRVHSDPTLSGAAWRLLMFATSVRRALSRATDLLPRMSGLAASLWRR